MKRLFLLSIALFLVCAVNAQTEFSIPNRTLQQKYDMSRFIMTSYITSCINAAKSDGMTAEEFGMKCGEAFIPVWDENTGFEQCVDWMLTYWTNLSDEAPIVEQSNDKVVITVLHINPTLENQDDFLGVSLDEFVAFIKASHVALFNHFDVGFNLTKEEEGFKTVITQ